MYRFKIGHIKLSKLTQYGSFHFINALSLAMFWTVWVIYLKSILKTDSSVAFVSSIFAFITFVSYFILVPVVEKLHEKKLLLGSLIMITISFLVFAKTNNISIIIAFGIIFTLAQSIRLQTTGILTRDLSTEKNLSKNEGIIFTILNLGWMVAPLLASMILLSYNVKIVFLVCAIFAILSFMIIKPIKIEEKEDSKLHENIFKNTKKYFAKKERIWAYILRGGLAFWWAFIYNIVPLYIIKHYSESIIGYFFFLVIMPLVIIEYPISRRVTTNNIHKVITIGFLILAACCLVIYLNQNPLFTLLILIISSFGAGIIEPNIETYFFKITSQIEEEKYYGPYSSSVDLFGIFAKLFPGILFLFFEFEIVFLFVAIFMALLAFAGTKAKIKNFHD